MELWLSQNIRIDPSLETSKNFTYPFNDVDSLALSNIAQYLAW
jgi:hypothetical protein